MADDVLPIGIKLETDGIERGAAALNTLANAGDKADASLRKVESAGAAAGKSISSLGGGATQPIKAVGEAADSAASGVNTLSKANERLSESATKARNAVGAGPQGLAGVLGIAKAAFAGFAGAFTVGAVAQMGREVLRIADSITNLNTQLRLSEGTAVGAANAYDALFAVAQRARVNFTDLGNTYAQIKRATDGLGLSSADTLRVTETLAKAITISGTSASAASAAMVQLSQGLASGTLRGEELNSIMEQTPRIARALADGLGVSIGQLRELGASGQLTGERVANALLRASDVIDREFGQAAVTAGQATVALGNSVAKLVGELDKQAGASQAAARGTLAMSRAVDELANSVARGESVTELGRLYDAAMRLLRGPSDADLARGAAQNDAILIARAQALKAVTDAARLADEAVSKFAGSAGNLSRAQLKLNDQNALLTQFAAAVRGFASDSAQYVRAYAALQQGLANIDAKYRERGAARGAGKSLSDELAAAQQHGRTYQSIINALIGVQTRYSEAAVDASEAQRILNRAIASGELSVLPQNLQDAIRAFAEHTEAIERNAKSLRERSNAEKELAESAAKVVAEIARSADEIDAQATRLAEEAALMWASTEATDAYALAKIDAAIATQRLALSAAELSQAEIAAINRQVDALERLRAATDVNQQSRAGRERLDAQADFRRQEADDWQKWWENIERGLTDSLFRAAEAGKSAFQSLRDAIRGMFNNLVLRPIISATVTAAGAALGLVPSAANAATGVATIGSLFGTGGFAGALAGGAGWLTGATTLGGSLSAGASLIGTGTMAGAASGAAMLAGALAPIALGVGLIASLLKSGGGPKTGGSFTSDATMARLFTPADQDALAASLAVNAARTFTDLLRSLGGTARGLQFGLGFDVDPRGTAQSRTSFVVGGTSVTADAGRSEQELQAALGLTVQRMLVSGLQQSDLPAVIAEVFSRIDVRTATQEQIESALQTARAIGTLIEAVRLLGVPVQLVTQAMLDAGGGAEKLTQSLGEYVANFYSESERTQIGLRALGEQFADLGFALPETRAQFRALVEAQDLTTEAGQRNAAALVGLAGAFADLVPAVEDAMRKLTASASEIDAYWKAVLSQSDYAALKLDELRGSFAALGVAMPQTLAQYRALVEGMDTSTDSGKALQIALGLLAGDFTRLVEGAESAADAISGLAKAAATISDNNALASFYSTILPDGDQLSGLLQTLVNESFGALDVPVPADAQEFIDLIGSIADPEKRSAVMGLAGAWARVQTAAQQAAELAARTWIETFQVRRGLFTPQEQIAQLGAGLTTDFASLGISMPSTRSGFAALLTQFAGTDVEQQLEALLPTWLDLIGLQEQLAAEAKRAADAQASAAKRAADAAIEEARRAAQAQIDALNRVRQSILDLFTDGDLLRLTPQQTLSAAQAVYEGLLKQAKSGDLAAINELPEIAKRYLDAASEMFASTQGFQDVRSQVIADLSALTNMPAPPTGRTYTATGQRADDGPDYDMSAWQQRDAQITTLKSIDRRLERLERRGRLEAAR